MVSPAYIYVMKLLLGLFAILAMATLKEKSFVGVAGSDPAVIGHGQMPAICSDHQKQISLIYANGDSLLCQTLSTRSSSFVHPQLIATLGGLHGSAMRGPQITSTTDGVCVAASTASGSIYAYVRDALGNWSRPARVTDQDSVAMEGFVALAGDGKDFLYAVWLDIRNTRRNKIYGASSFDGGRSWSKNELIYASPDSSVCECCKPGVAVNDKHVSVMFRNWLKGNRDLYLTQSFNQGRTFQAAAKLGIDSWPLNGCPMDGGAVTYNQLGGVQTVWNRKGTIYACQPGQQEQALGEGKGCTMTTVQGKNVHAWIDNKQVVVRMPGGVKTTLGEGRSVVLQGLGDNAVLCVWENNKQLYAKIVAL